MVPAQPAPFAVAAPKRRRAERLLTSTALTAVALALAAAPASANPQGGAVVGGSATITQSGNTLTVHQATDRAAINWQSFNVAPGETTRFVQPNSGSWTLNSVFSPNAAVIAGSLQANGNIIIQSGAGIMFGPSASVHVGGLIATTAHLSTEKFMAGRLEFDRPGNPDATIVNQGLISIADSGLAAFVAPGVQNAGIIQAKLGRVALGS